MSGPPVHAEWTRMIGNHRIAQVAKGVMENPDATEEEKLAAGLEYFQAASEVIADLGLLSERMVLARITLFLSRRERA